MSENGISSIRKQYNDLSLDLNLDQATAEEAWNNYSTLRISYTLEGDQLPWLACALYTAGRKCSVPTVGGRPGNMIQGNCVSLTRMLQYCNLPLTEFIMKLKSWLAMSHLDEDFCRRVELLERNFAVSNNIFKKYKTIFVALFQDPANDPARPPRSRKQRRPPCTATELFHFCWALYILIKGKYPSIPQDLVSCYSLLLACIDLMYCNVLSSRRDLINSSFEGLPESLVNNPNCDLSAWPETIMDLLCKKFDGILVDTKVVREYYWKPNIKDLVESGVLKGTSDGTCLLDQVNFDHNEKEMKKAYEEYLLSHGEFDERMFLTSTIVSEPQSVTSSPRRALVTSFTPNANTTPILSKSSVPAYGYLSQACNGDHHLVPQTPITGKTYTHDRPVVGKNPLAVITSGLQRLYALIAGRTHTPSEELLNIFRSLKNNPEERINNLVQVLGNKFSELYGRTTEEYTAPSIEFIKMRLQMGQMLFFTFLEHILIDEKKRGVDLEAILKEDLFHRTLFTCCLEIVLKSYNDARRFPWSLQVSSVDPYYFIRIIEPVIRSEKQCENQLSKEFVNHLKGIEEQILDSLAWREDSPLWQILQNTGQGVPSCQEVNFAHQLENSNVELAVPLMQASSIMSPAVSRSTNPQQSPLSSMVENAASPGGQGSARRMLFPSATSSGPAKTETTRLLTPSFRGRPGTIGIRALNSQIKSFVNSSPAAATQDKVPEVNSSKPESIESIFKSPPIVGSSAGQVQPIQQQVNQADSSLEKKKEKPRRHGSLALFFRKFYTLANMRLRDLCDRLDIVDAALRQRIWTCFEHSIIHYSDMMKDRHMDQMIMCAIYIICRISNIEKNFQEIMKHYRNQPQAASHVYRSVFISRGSNTGPVIALEGSDQGPPNTPSQCRGTSANLPSGERGDLIKFYNSVYVSNLKIFALRFRSDRDGDAPPLSPLPVLPRATPVSPRKKISVNQNIFINSLNSLSPMKQTNLSPKRPLPYYFNRSPAKNLKVINNMVKMQDGMGNRRLQGIMQDRQFSPDTTDPLQISEPPHEGSPAAAQS